MEKMRQQNQVLHVIFSKFLNTDVKKCSQDSKSIGPKCTTPQKTYQQTKIRKESIAKHTNVQKPGGETLQNILVGQNAKAKPCKKYQSTKIRQRNLAKHTKSAKPRKAVNGVS